MDSLSDPVYLEELAVACGAGSVSHHAGLIASQQTIGNQELGSSGSSGSSPRISMTLQPLGSMVSPEHHHHHHTVTSHHNPSSSLNPSHHGQTGDNSGRPGLSAAGRISTSHGSSTQLHPVSHHTSPPPPSSSSTARAQHSVTAHNISPIKVEPHHTRITNIGKYTFSFTLSLSLSVNSVYHQK